VTDPTRDQSWREDAACLSHDDPDIWFPGPNDEACRKAKDICAGCPVREPCLEYALANHIRDGVWGGYGEYERKRIRRRRRQQAAS
jgi:WhiB family redox-sensing transcriptional regulator